MSRLRTVDVMNVDTWTSTVSIILTSTARVLKSTDRFAFHNFRSGKNETSELVCRINEKQMWLSRSEDICTRDRDDPAELIWI